MRRRVKNAVRISGFALQIPPMYFENMLRSKGIETVSVFIPHHPNYPCRLVLGYCVANLKCDDDVWKAVEQLNDVIYDGLPIVGNSSKLHDLSRSRSRLHIPARTPSCANSTL